MSSITNIVWIMTKQSIVRVAKNPPNQLSPDIMDTLIINIALFARDATLNWAIPLEKHQMEDLYVMVVLVVHHLLKLLTTQNLKEIEFAFLVKSPSTITDIHYRMVMLCMQHAYSAISANNLSILLIQDLSLRNRAFFSILQIALTNHDLNLVPNVKNLYLVEEFL